MVFHALPQARKKSSQPASPLRPDMTGFFVRNLKCNYRIMPGGGGVRDTGNIWSSPAQETTEKVPDHFQVVRLINGNKAARHLKFQNSPRFKNWKIMMQAVNRAGTPQPDSTGFPVSRTPPPPGCLRVIVYKFSQ